MCFGGLPFSFAIEKGREDSGMTKKSRIFAKDRILCMTAMNKDQLYQQLTAQARSLVDGVDNVVGALGNVAALLKEELPYYFWVGFYVVKDGRLQLGPFQGPVACYSIEKGRGVCGTAWDKAGPNACGPRRASVPRAYCMLLALQFRDCRTGNSWRRGRRCHRCGQRRLWRFRRGR